MVAAVNRLLPTARSTKAAILQVSKQFRTDPDCLERTFYRRRQVKA